MQTSASSGEVYVPGTPQTSTAAAPQQASMNIQAQQAAMNAQAQQNYAAQYPANQQGQMIMQAPQNGAQYGNAYGAPAQAQYQTPMAANGGMQTVQMPVANPTEQVQIGQGNYLVGVQTSSGTRVKTVVSR